MATGYKKYVVMSDAIVVTLGKKPNGRADHTRVMRGGLINGNPESEQIRNFLRLGAISEASNKAEADELRKKRLTVRMAAAKSGAPDDPVEAPQSAVLPVPAPLPETSPDAILAGADEA